MNIILVICVDGANRNNISSTYENYIRCRINGRHTEYQNRAASERVRVYLYRFYEYFYS